MPTVRSILTFAKIRCRGFVMFAKQRNVDAVLFGGDYFDSRSSIDVKKTMNIATESLYMLANEGFPVSMILGNHDLYLRDSTSIPFFDCIWRT